MTNAMPQTGGYYHAGYIAASALYLLYALTLWRRATTLRQQPRAPGGVSRD